MQEKPTHEMYLKEKQQFEYAKFCQFIDELDDGLFDTKYFNKEQIKNWLFSAINNHPQQGIAWGIDRVFNKIIQDANGYPLQKLGALRLKLSEAISNNFKTKEFIFPAPKTTDTETDIEMEEIKDDDQPEDDGGLKLKRDFKETSNTNDTNTQKADDTVLTKEVSYLPRQVDIFINKIPEQYFGLQDSSRESLITFFKNRLIQLKKSEKLSKLNTEVARRIKNDITCPNADVLIEIFTNWLNGQIDEDPIICFTPDGKPINKLNLDQYQLVTFANFCNFVDQLELDENLLGRAQLKEIFYDILQINPDRPVVDLIEKASLLLYRSLHINLQESGRSMGNQEFEYLNHLYKILHDAAERNFTVTESTFFALSDQKTNDPIDKLDKYGAGKRQLKIADEIWEKDKDDDLPN